MMDILNSGAALNKRMRNLNITPPNIKTLKDVPY